MLPDADNGYIIIQSAFHLVEYIENALISKKNAGKMGRNANWCKK